MRAEKYGHHLSRMNPASPSVPAATQPKLGRGQYEELGAGKAPKMIQPNLPVRSSREVLTYNPGSRGRQEKIAHELMHVVQQKGRPQLRHNNSKPSEQLNDSQSPLTPTPMHPRSIYASVIQRQVSVDQLRAERDKVKVSGSYQGTIDEETSTEVANKVGAEWVGEGHNTGKYGPPHNYRLTSVDKQYQYRPPMVKKQSKLSGTPQANYEWRRETEPDFCFNAHVTVTDDPKTITDPENI